MEAKLSEKLEQMMNTYKGYNTYKKLAVRLKKLQDQAVAEMALLPSLNETYCKYVKMEIKFQQSMYAQAMVAYRYKNQKDCKLIETPEEFNKVVKSIFKTTFKF